MEKIPKEPEIPLEEDVNFHEISSERHELRKALKEIVDSPIEKTVGETLKNSLEDLNKKAREFSVEELGGLTAAKEFLKSEKEKAKDKQWTDEVKIKEELGLKYAELKEIRDEYRSLCDFELKKMREAKTNPYTAKMYDSIQETILIEKEKLENKKKQIGTTDPILFQAAKLIEYKKGLHEEGHIAHTPSVDEALNEIGTRMISGKPMFLHGPTGTGKTSLARYAAEHFTGTSAEMVYCNPQTRESNIWGKTGIKPTEGGGIETVDVYGPLARAMSSGKTVIFDEFTALPREQMVFVKGVFNAKIGDKVNIMGNGIVEIMPGFQMIFTANLKSEKNPERQELPPEIAREFEQNNLEIGYTPKGEAYDIVLSRLMNKDGSLDMSYEDLNITLPKFLEAMDEVQIAYTDRANENTAKLTGTMDASGKRPGLKKLVFTQGTIEAIMDGWITEKQTNKKHKSFTEFLDSRLKTALTFKEYPEADRMLAAKILASKGLLKTLSAEDLGLPESVFGFDVAKKQRGDKESIKKLTESSKDEKHLSLKEVALLDPFNRGKKEVKDIAESFLGKEDEQEKKEKFTGGQEEIQKTFDPFLLETYKGWGVDQTKLDTIKFSPKLTSPENLNYTEKKSDIDVSKYGEYTINPSLVGLDWEIIPQDKIKVFNLSDMVGKSLDEVANHIVSTYGAKFEIPGLDYYKFILEHPDKAPDSLKDGKYYFMFGSLFRSSDGDWDVPCLDWDGSGFGRCGIWLGHGWGDGCRVVLLER